jgi:hypothetical protein
MEGHFDVLGFSCARCLDLHRAERLAHQPDGAGVGEQAIVKGGKVVEADKLVAHFPYRVISVG